MDSLTSLDLWINHINIYNNASNGMMTPIYIIVNKCDLTTKKFKQQDVLKTLDEYSNMNLSVYEMSAKTNLGIDYVFDQLTCLLTGRSTYFSNNDSFVKNSYAENVALNHRRSFRLSNLEKKKKSCC